MHKRTSWDDSAVFDVQSWMSEQHTKQQVVVEQPKQLGCWTKASITQGSSYSFGSIAGLLAYKCPRLPLDLNQGREQYVKKSGADKGDVEVVMKAAAAAGTALSDIDVVTFRNNLNKVFGTPLDPSASWAVDACWRGGVLFLDIVQLEQQWWGNPADAEKFTYWGYRFEAACVGEAVTDASSEYGVLVKACIGGLRVLLGAEVDCYDPAACAGVCGTQPPGLSSYVEIKTYRLPQNPKQQFNLHRNKHPKWWLQSYLAGVPTLALGGRDDQGIVHRVDLVRTSDLPRISASTHGAAWNPQVSLCFGVAALKWMQGVAAAHPQQQLRFSYDGGNKSVRWEVQAQGALPRRVELQLQGVGGP